MIQVVVTQENNDVYNVFEFHTEQEKDWFIHQLPESMRSSILDPQAEKKIVNHQAQTYSLIRRDVIVSTLIALFIWTVAMALVAFVVFVVFVAGKGSAANVSPVPISVSVPTLFVPTPLPNTQNEIVITPLITPRGIGQQPIATVEPFVFTSIGGGGSSAWSFVVVALVAVLGIAALSIWLSRGSDNR